MTFKFSIKSSTHYLGFLRRIMAAIGRLAPGFDHASIAKCSLALVEAVNNAIFHAHKKNEENWIDISIRLDGTKVIIKVKDTGPGFDIGELSDPPVDSTHGRGLLIISSVMNEVSYVRGKKNVLKMSYFM